MKLNFSFSFGGQQTKNLSSTDSTSKKSGKSLPWKPRSVYRCRQTIDKWTRAIDLFNNVENPRNYPIQEIYNEVMNDAHLTGQINNRRQQLFSSNILLKNENGEVDQKQTDFLRNLAAYRVLTNGILDAELFSNTLAQMSLFKNDKGLWIPQVEILPRTNVVQQKGRFYQDYGDELKFENYREMPEYGTWILEFDSGNIGRLNKVVSHVLFKRFAQQCWSELAEIYGIPPRVIKTNTDDQQMLDRAEKMMKETGSAPWFIIDESEEFEWGQAVQTKGEVFESLIQMCNNEISIVESGAVIGQDTKNGNRSKEQVAQDVLWLLVQSDMALVAEKWNTIILPAFKNLGILKGNLTFEFEPAEDLGELWTRTNDALSFFDVDPIWIKDKFGIEVIGPKSSSAPIPPDKKKLKLNGFFD